MKFTTITHPRVLELGKQRFQNMVDIERMLMLYDRIYQFSTYKKFDLSLDEKDKYNAWVTISKKYLRRLLGGKKKTDIIIKAMIDLGIISIMTSKRQADDGSYYECETYKVGKKAKSYRINEEFAIRQGMMKPRNITEYKNLKAIANCNKSSAYNSTLSSPKYEHIATNVSNVGINYEEAENFICKFYNGLSDFRKLDYRYRIPNWLYTATKINEQDTFVSRGNNGRLMTSLVGLKKELRSFLYDKVDGNYDFIEIDICNCQPLLIACYIEKHYPDKAKNEDFKLWKSVCQDGDIYGFIGRSLNVDRKKIKKHFMQVLLYTVNNKSYLLDERNWGPENKERREFLLTIRKFFPTIRDVLLAIKSRIGNSEFAKEIQRMEAHLMIDNVLVDLKNIGTNFSIHDSIVCKSADAEFVKEKIKYHMQRIFKTQCTLKETDLKVLQEIDLDN